MKKLLTLLLSLIWVSLYAQDGSVRYAGVYFTDQPKLENWTKLTEGYYRYSGFELQAGYFDRVIFSTGDRIVYRFEADKARRYMFERIYSALVNQFGEEMSNSDYTLEMIRNKENKDIEHPLWEKRVAELPSYEREWVLDGGLALLLRWTEGDGSPITVIFTLPNENH